MLKRVIIVFNSVKPAFTCVLYKQKTILIILELPPNRTKYNKTAHKTLRDSLCIEVSVSGKTF